MPGAEKKFEVGDVVRLVGGGPKMTVEQVFTGIQYAPIHCAWFEQDESGAWHALKRGCFQASVLREVE